MLENEKLDWLGRQIRILKAKPGDEGIKECQENAKQMQPQFTSADELEIIKFFIHEGGNGNGDGKSNKPEGDAKNNGSAPPPPESDSLPPPPPEEAGKPPEKSVSGESESSKVIPDGNYIVEKNTSSESYIDMIPADSPHRLRKGRAITDNKELLSYLFSAYGPKFILNKYGDKISITL
jgi:hypothetical protein